MTEIGYALSSEEHGPIRLVEHARMAADAGFGAAAISDHFHPWLEEQGESPHVWTVVGAIASATPLALTTTVTCPIIRNHPVLIAHAAATASLLLGGRFELGVGTGERLNEQVLGDRWPPTAVRQEMLAEAVEVMRRLWTGEEVTHRGRHYTVEDARIFSNPPQPPPVLVSAFGEKATDMAARIGDGLVTTHPNAEMAERYRRAAGRGPVVGTMKICWGPDRQECVERAHRLWRSSGLPGDLGTELRLPAELDAASTLVTPEALAGEVPCGPDPDPIVEMVGRYVEAGFDRVYVHQIGPDQQEFLDFFQHALLPALADVGATTDADASTVDLRERDGAR